MKKVGYILVVLVGALAASCSKENIQPTAQTGNPIPQWKSTQVAVDEGDSEGEGGITDPNNDSDDKSRKRNH